MIWKLSPKHCSKEICMAESLLLIPENYKSADRAIYIHCGCCHSGWFLNYLCKEANCSALYLKLCQLYAQQGWTFHWKFSFFFTLIFFILLLTVTLKKMNHDHIAQCFAQTLKRIITRSCDIKFHKQNLTGLYFSWYAINVSWSNTAE